MGYFGECVNGEWYLNFVVKGYMNNVFVIFGVVFNVDYYLWFVVIYKFSFNLFVFYIYICL